MSKTLLDEIEELARKITSIDLSQKIIVKDTEGTDE